jgi:hypothetical protein
MIKQRKITYRREANPMKLRSIKKPVGKRLNVIPRSPSIETIMKRLDITKSKAFDIKECMIHAVTNEGIYNAMKDINIILGGYGVESIRVNDWNSRYWQDIGALFISMGDTYDQTILYDVDKNRFEAWTFGDWVEYNEKRVL